MSSYWSKKATGGAIASNLVHQAAVGALLALELLRDPALLHPSGEGDQEWELHVESLDDLAIVWTRPAIVFVQVKNQKLNAALLDETIRHWKITSPAGTPSALRIHALAGCIDKLSSLAGDLDALRVLTGSAVATTIKDKARIDLADKYPTVTQPLDERITIDERAARLEAGGRMFFADALRQLDDTRLISRTSSDHAFDALTFLLTSLLPVRGWVSREEIRASLTRAVIARFPLDAMDHPAL